MPRIVIKSATGPVEVKTPKGDSVWICACGLTDNADGTCSGNHKKLKLHEEDPDKLYQYDEGDRLEVAQLPDEYEEDDDDDDDDDEDECEGCCSGSGKGKKDGCCGGGCCGGGCKSGGDDDGCCRDEGRDKGDKD